MKWWNSLVRAVQNACVKRTQPEEVKEALESLGYAVAVVPSDDVSNGWYLVTMLLWDKYGHEYHRA